MSKCDCAINTVRLISTSRDAANQTALSTSEPSPPSDLSHPDLANASPNRVGLKSPK